MRRILPLFLLSSVAFAAPMPESTSVSSSSADYDGNMLSLKGSVLLDHGLGKMSAEEAELERQETGKDFPFSLIHLRKEVFLHLKNHTELKCDEAELDFVSLKGHLKAKNQGKVTFTDAMKKGTLQVMSDAAELEMAKNGHDGKKTDFDLTALYAVNNVIINYADFFTLNADHAIYKKQATTSSKEFQGTVTAYPKDAQTKVRITHENDLIEADTVSLDPVHAKIAMQNPKGLLTSSLIPSLDKGELRFNCTQLTWDHGKNLVSMKGHVRVEDPVLGYLSADDELQIKQAELKGKRTIQALFAKGKTTIQYRDPANETVHRLTSYGTMRLDRENLQATIESPLVDGNVPLDFQLYYEEQQMAVYSDKATIAYSLIEGTLQPVSINLAGNIRLFSNDPKKAYRCGVADRINYSPTTRTLILSANPGKKVLFWDSGEALRVSAQEIHVTQDPSTHKDVVKGVGKVQFAFTAEEQSLLKKFFSQYESHE
jgi:hypothetical protein